MAKWIFSFFLLLIVAPYLGKAGSIFIYPIDSPPTINTHLHAEKILLGKVRPGDDRATFACMDSLLSENKDTQTYYFQVMRVIASKSDGALSEMVSVKLKEYLENQPVAFLENYKTLTEKEQENFVLFIGYEYFLDANDKKSASKSVKDFFESLSKHCSKCDKYKKEIKDITEGIISIIELQSEDGR